MTAPADTLHLVPPPSERLRVALMMGVGDEFTVEINADAARALLAEVAIPRAAPGQMSAAADRRRRAARDRWFAVGLWVGLFIGLTLGVIS